jgi:hypothetical protein
VPVSAPRGPPPGWGRGHRASLGRPVAATRPGSERQCPEPAPRAGNVPRVSSLRRCSRTACAHSAVATLTYVYNDSTAVLGPLALYAEPHTYDLCAAHAERLTAPRGWEVVRLAPDLDEVGPTTDDLLALADGVGQGEEVVVRRLGLDVLAGQAHDLPAARGGQALRVDGAQVVGVRLGEGRERADHRGLVAVDVGERRDGGLGARGAGAPPGQTHVADSMPAKRGPRFGTP